MVYKQHSSDADDYNGGGNAVLISIPVPVFSCLYKHELDTHHIKTTTDTRMHAHYLAWNIGDTCTILKHILYPGLQLRFKRRNYLHRPIRAGNYKSRDRTSVISKLPMSGRVWSIDRFLIKRHQTSFEADGQSDDLDRVRLRSREQNELALYHLYNRLELGLTLISLRWLIFLRHECAWIKTHH